MDGEVFIFDGKIYKLTDTGYTVEDIDNGEAEPINWHDIPEEVRADARRSYGTRSYVEVPELRLCRSIFLYGACILWPDMVC